MKWITFAIIFIMISLSFAQHRGDNLSFQGLTYPIDASVRGMAMGGAFSSISGDVTTLFYNPAGLADLENFQISIAAGNRSQIWRENQNYRPNRIYWTLAFYLEELYIPDPENNGVWDYIVAQDTNYKVLEPELGLEPHSEEAADWKNDFNDFGLNNVVAAMPFKIANQKLVISAAYRKQRIWDFDRNDTYLDPHIGFDAYGIVPRVVTDTISFSWSRFERSRKGNINSIQGALAYDFKPGLKFAVGINSQNGESDDFQSLERVGIFDIAKDNRFRFTYDTLTTTVNGNSKFDALSFNVGLQLQLQRLRFGLNIKLPYTYTRKWQYRTKSVDPALTESTETSGTDKIEIPTTYTFGLNIQPVDRFLVSFDYYYAPYSRAKFKYESENETHRDWVDQSILCFGIEFKAYEYLSFQAGYRELPAVFVPDGTAIQDSGPKASGYTLGTSLKLLNLGRIDFAYEYRKLKYNDSYYSNTNYAFESMNHFLMAFTFTL